MQYLDQIASVKFVRITICEIYMLNTITMAIQIKNTKHKWKKLGKARFKNSKIQPQGGFE